MLINTTMKITDVVPLLEYGAIGSKALGGANFKMLVDFYQGRKTAATLTLTFGDDVIKLGDLEVDALADHYNKLEDMSDKRDFVYSTMSRLDKFMALANRLNLHITPVSMSGGQAGLFERRKEQPDLSRSGVKDPKLSVALRQAYAKYPSARSDIEAFIRNEIENQTATDQNFSSQSKTNARQDQTLDRLRDVSKKQSQQIANLDQENDDLDNELNQLNREIDSFERQLGQVGSKEPAVKRQITLPKSDTAPMGAAAPAQTRRADNRQQREKDKGQRNTDKVTKSSFSSSQTMPSYSFSPTAITDKPQSTADSPLPTKVDRPSRSTPNISRDPDSNVTYMYGKPVELPSKSTVDDPPTSITRQKDMFEPPRTGTLGEAMSRLKHLAGL